MHRAWVQGAAVTLSGPPCGLVAQQRPDRHRQSGVALRPSPQRCARRALDAADDRRGAVGDSTRLARPERCPPPKYRGRGRTSRADARAAAPQPPTDPRPARRPTTQREGGGATPPAPGLVLTDQGDTLDSGPDRQPRGDVLFGRLQLLHRMPGADGQVRSHASPHHEVQLNRAPNGTWSANRSRSRASTA